MNLEFSYNLRFKNVAIIDLIDRLAGVLRHVKGCITSKTLGCLMSFRLFLKVTFLQI